MPKKPNRLIRRKAHRGRHKKLRSDPERRGPESPAEAAARIERALREKEASDGG